MKAVLILLFLLCSCTTKRNEETGFLTTYANFSPDPSLCAEYAVPQEIVEGYTIVLIDPVVLNLADPSESEVTNLNDLNHLKEYLFQALNRELADNYLLVTVPGPGVARLRVSITNLSPATP